MITIPATDEKIYKLLKDLYENNLFLLFTEEIVKEKYSINNLTLTNKSIEENGIVYDFTGEVNNEIKFNGGRIDIQKIPLPFRLKILIEDIHYDNVLFSVTWLGRGIHSYKNGVLKEKGNDFSDLIDTLLKDIYTVIYGR